MSNRPRYIPPKGVNIRGAWSPVYMMEIPRTDSERLNAYKLLLEWCETHNQNLNGFFSSIIPAICYHCQNFTTFNKEKQPVVSLNLGTIVIKSACGWKGYHLVPKKIKRIRHNLRFTIEARAAYYDQRQWCVDVGINFADWFYTLLIPLVYYAINYTVKTPDCNVAIILNLGNVTFIRQANREINYNFQYDAKC